MAVGDVCFGIDVAPVLTQKGFAYPWSAEEQTLSQADITICNLENALTTRGEPSPSQDSFPQRGDPAAVDAMKEAGVDLVVLANDHVMDYGADGLADTLSALDRAGIAHCGAGFNESQASSPTVMEISGSRIAFLAFSRVILPGYAAEPDKPGVATIDDIAALEEAVSKARAVSDCVVVYFHWGELGSSNPQADEMELAAAATDAGACLVLGSHPHVLQGLQRRGSALIAYSLGNFIFNPPREEGRQTGILQVTLRRGRVEEARFQPAYITYCQPFPARGKKAEEILAKMSELSAALDTELVIEEEAGLIRF
jgi:poly-gamma-glutamate synthesis protein (capsule biosynthesis protein)